MDQFLPKHIRERFLSGPIRSFTEVVSLDVDRLYEACSPESPVNFFESDTWSDTPPVSDHRGQVHHVVEGGRRMDYNVYHVIALGKATLCSVEGVMSAGYLHKKEDEDKKLRTWASQLGNSISSLTAEVHDGGHTWDAIKNVYSKIKLIDAAICARSLTEHLRAHIWKEPHEYDESTHNLRSRDNFWSYLASLIESILPKAKEELARQPSHKHHPEWTRLLCAMELEYSDKHRISNLYEVDIESCIRAETLKVFQLQIILYRLKQLIGVSNADFVVTLASLDHHSSLLNPQWTDRAKARYAFV